MRQGRLTRWFFQNVGLASALLLFTALFGCDSPADELAGT